MYTYIQCTSNAPLPKGTGPTHIVRSFERNFRGTGAKAPDHMAHTGLRLPLRPLHALLEKRMLVPTPLFRGVGSVFSYKRQRDVTKR